MPDDAPSPVPGGTPAERDERSAIVSDDGLYRYSLNRWWLNTNDAPSDLWVMLNPSTADASEDDPTVRRCVGFSKGWGAKGLTVVNLYAYRATKPAAMWAAQKAGVDIVGPECDSWIRAHARVVADQGGRVIVAWGAGADGETGRLWKVSRMLPDALCLGFTSKGAPRHPLYVRGDAELSRWSS